MNADGAGKTAACPQPLQRPRWMSAALLVLAAVAGTGEARDLEVEVEVLHVGGMLAPAELDSLLADARLAIEITYHPARLIEGVTARRERTLPLGSRLYAIPRQAELRGAQVERRGRTLRFRVAGTLPGESDYRPLRLALRTPIAKGPGRPQPDLDIDLLNPVPASGSQETALYTRHGAFDLGTRVRYRWSDAKGATTMVALTCNGDVLRLANGEYRFRRQHRLAELFRSLAPAVQSDPPARDPAGQRSLRLREPFPEPLAGWRLSRNHLLQLSISGERAERLSIYAEQAGPGQCRRARAYDALFSGARLVALERHISESECPGAAGGGSASLEAQWLEDGSLAAFRAGTREWDAFAAGEGSRCAAGAPPPESELRAVETELQRIREAFLRR